MKRSIGVLLGLALMVAAPARAEELVITGSASVPIQGGRALDARGEALSRALDQALTKAVARILEVDREDLTDEQQELIEVKVLPARKDYQEKFEVLEEEKDADGASFRVRVRAVFVGDKLRDALLQLGLVKRARTWERVMVMIPERHLARFIPDPAAETNIIKGFVEARYRVVDQSQIAAIRGTDQAAAAARGDIAAAQAIGRKFGAEIIVVGEAFSQAVDGARTEQVGMRTCRARVEVRMLRTDTGEILAASDEHFSGIDATEELAAKKALANAGGQVAKYLLDQLDKRAREDKKEGAPKIVELVVMDIPYAQYAQLKETMKAGITGIQNYRQRGYEANRAELEVEYGGADAQALADALALAKFRDFKLTILKASVNRIDMKAAPR
jgi:hypothetical protein